jgi:type IV pilus assembly protein PilX
MKTVFHSPPLHAPTRRRPARCAHHQRGVVMLFGLLALVIMMIGAVAMMRSMNTQLFNAGNLGFKRDITNQGELATAMVLQAMGGVGALSTETKRRSHLTANNYSATILKNNAQGLPEALISDTEFAKVALNTNDIANDSQGIKVRYVVDRLCANTGVADPSHCTMSDAGKPVGGSVTEAGNNGNAEDRSEGGEGAVAPQVVYRLSIRVEGPRRTQAFFQTTLTL